jgi:hypothetical protein
MTPHASPPETPSAGGLEPDHLVVAARTLDEGAAWCEATTGVAPGPGGRHPLMGTHNRLLSLATASGAPAYLEIIAIDPQAPPPGRARWFDLDDAALQAALAGGPRLIHWVARTASLDAALAAWRTAGLDGGRALAASRETPAGLLQWRIGVRDDGRRGHGGALPTLIEWAGPHPVAAMPSSGLSLRSLTLQSAEPEALRAALRLAGGAPAVDVVAGVAGSPPLEAWLDTPRGPCRLVSP